MFCVFCYFKKRPIPFTGLLACLSLKDITHLAELRFNLRLGAGGSSLGVCRHAPHLRMVRVHLGLLQGLELVEIMHVDAVMALLWRRGRHTERVQDGAHAVGVERDGVEKDLNGGATAPLDKGQQARVESTGKGSNDALEIVRVADRAEGQAKAFDVARGPGGQFEIARAGGVVVANGDNERVGVFSIDFLLKPATSHANFQALQAFNRRIQRLRRRREVHIPDQGGPQVVATLVSAVGNEALSQEGWRNVVVAVVVSIALVAVGAAENLNRLEHSVGLLFALEFVVHLHDHAIAEAGSDKRSEV